MKVMDGALPCFPGELLQCEVRWWAGEEGLVNVGGELLTCHVVISDGLW